jgi:serine/threonine protein kinase
MSSCPGERTLRLLGDDALGDETYAAIEHHVQGCPECTAVLERLAQRHPEATVDQPEHERFPQIPGFEIRSKLGHGAMGVVYRAIQTGPNRLVALKIITGGFGSDASIHIRRRWLREARAISKVPHPNVVTLYDCGETDGCFFLVLEYITGGSLKDRLAEPLPPRTAAGLMETIARAVGFLHQHGLFHFDLKPSNILLDGDGEVDAAWDRIRPRVSDFGLALCLGDQDVTETSLAGPRGTASYMAPEQASATRAPLGAAADIHALGAMLYHLLTGRPPFLGASTIETLDQVRVQNPVPLRRLNPKIPRDLETIALKCLEKNPSRRYASAEALADDLRRWLDGKPISARPVSLIEHCWRWCRRRPVIAALAASLVVTLSVGLLAIVMLWRHDVAARNYADQERGHADAERLRAEASYKAARVALAEMLAMGIQGLFETNALSSDDFIHHLQVARNRLFELDKLQSHDPETWKLLAYTNLHLGKALDLQAKPVEAHPFHVEAILNWEKILRQDPHDLFAQHHRWESLVPLPKVIEQQGNAEESVREWERTISVGESMLPFMLQRELADLASCRIYLARLVDRLGDHERARMILEANFRMRDTLPAEAKNTDTLKGIELSTRVELPLVERFPELESLAADEWAQRFIPLLDSTSRTDNKDPTLKAESEYRLIQSLSGRASSERRTAKIDDARRTTDRINALAKLMLARYPDQPAAHLALKEAFKQRAKDAWQLDDRGAVERNWKLALAEARQALVLDPKNVHARHDVPDLERRLNDLIVPKREAQASVEPSGQL